MPGIKSAGSRTPLGSEPAAAAAPEPAAAPAAARAAAPATPIRPRAAPPAKAAASPPAAPAAKAAPPRARAVAAAAPVPRPLALPLLQLRQHVGHAEVRRVAQVVLALARLAALGQELLRTWGPSWACF